MHKHNGKNITCMVLGNKNDVEERQIPTKFGEDLAAKHNLSFFETSAKTGENITEAFTSLARQIIQRTNPENVPQ